METISLRNAEVTNVPVILNLIHELALYENMSKDVTNTEEKLINILNEKYAEVVIASYHSIPVGFAHYFYNYSTF